MKIFFSVGDPSGDVHGANLIRQMKQISPEVECVGFGGPKMEEAGCDLHFDLTSLAVMWLLQVFANLGKFFGLVNQASNYFRQHRPEAVVLIDYPGFNWWIARRAKAAGIPVFYYMPPQLWAWGSWRVKKMRRSVDHVLCALPFEQAWYTAKGCRATLVGHPFFDEVQRHEYDQAFLKQQQQAEGPLVAILPGSRTQEVVRNLKWFVQAAEYVQKLVPNVRFAVAAFKPAHAEMARQALANSPVKVEVHCGKTPELMAAAHCTMSVSGSVSLELLSHAKPTVVLYHVSKLGYGVQKQFRRVKYITLVNLLSASDGFSLDLTPYHPGQANADEILFPEYLTTEDRSGQIAAHVVEWLQDKDRYREQVARLVALRDRVAQPGGSQRAAEFILRTLQRPRAAAGPHYLPHQHVASSGNWAEKYLA